MKPINLYLQRFVRATLPFLLLAALSGCASLVSNAASGFADNLGAAVLNQDDPATVRDGAPAYLLLLDSLLEGNPENPDILAAAAQLYASYGAIFADDPTRAMRLTERARGYSKRAMCITFKTSCEWDDLDFAAYEASLSKLQKKHADYVLAYGVASLAWIRAHSADWNALAELPHMEALLKRYLDIGERSETGAVYTYLGILATLRPPALGGQPEQGRAYFEQAVELTEGRDLSVKVEFARGYARLMYDRELHDELLGAVLAANPNVAGYTLTNVLAQRDAVTLMASADEYF